MNLGLIFQLMPLMPRIEKMLATVQRYENDPEVGKAIDLLKKIETDPEVKDAIATAEEVAKILTATGNTNAKASIGNTGGGAIG